MATDGRKAGRWQADSLYIIDGSIVGTAGDGKNGWWHAYGCMREWQDTNLGAHVTKEAARKAVEDWAEREKERRDG